MSVNVSADLAKDVKTVAGWLARAMPSFFPDFQGRAINILIYLSNEDGRAQARGRKAAGRGVVSGRLDCDRCRSEREGGMDLRAGVGRSGARR